MAHENKGQGLGGGAGYDPIGGIPPLDRAREPIEPPPTMQEVQATITDTVRAAFKGHLDHYHPVEAQTIEQELEAGLHKSMEGWRTIDYKVCTRIFLPAAKYEEYTTELQERYRPDDPKRAYGYLVKFYDIPVLSYSGDEIIYCTD